MALSARFHPAHEHSFSTFPNTSRRDRAGGFIDRIEASCLSLRTFPEMRREGEDLSPDLRMHPFERRAMIVYRVTPEAVGVLGSYCGGRDLAALSDLPTGA